MKHALTLMAVTALGGAASADTSSTQVVAVAPRTLATGAPACGNVMGKYGEDPICRVVRGVARDLRALEALGHKFDAELRNLDAQLPSLTLPAAPRPGL
jgi:hypothetical protein